MMATQHRQRPLGAALFDGSPTACTWANVAQEWIPVRCYCLKTRPRDPSPCCCR